jgi:hypothetical protein
MAQRRHHYEVAFEAFLRARKIPYISVDEAKRALMPRIPSLSIESGGPALKAFDFVVYGSSHNLLVEAKGRRIRPTKSGTARLESWVTLDDVRSLRAWQGLFGDAFTPCLLFLYWCDEQPPDALFQELFEHKQRWYALRSITLSDYERHMRVRSPKWGTVDLHPQDFERLSEPFCATTGSLDHPTSPSMPLFALDPIRA